MSNQIHQIYHVARCGSTLLTYLLSNVCKSYAEPGWSRSLLLGIDPYKNMESFYDSIVKFPSMTSCFETNFPGKKVFLYRPLSQHLCKMKSVDQIWSRLRFDKIDYIFKNHNHHLITNWNPQDDLEKITYLWVCSVFRMMDQSEVLWIKTNDFLENKEKILNEVCDHFGLPFPNDFSFSDINVKKMSLNGGNDPVNNLVKEIDSFEYTFPSYGLISTEMALYDLDIKRRVEKIENKYPEIKKFLY